jgi:hypothetical protein
MLMARPIIIFFMKKLDIMACHFIQIFFVCYLLLL